MTWFHPAGTLASGDADLVVTPDTAPWTYSGLQVFTLRPGATVTVTLSEDEDGWIMRASGPDGTPALEARAWQ